MIEFLKSEAFDYFLRVHMIDVVVIIPSPNAFPVDSWVYSQRVEHHGHGCR